MLAVVGAMTMAGDLRAEEPVGPLTGEVRLESGRVVQYAIHHDRNSIHGSVTAGDRLIALTASGGLILFDRSSVRPVRERLEVVPVVCLGRGEGETVLAGLEDGRVCQVDPETLELTPVGTLESGPQWVGWIRDRGKGRPAGLVAVARRTKLVERHGDRFEMPYSVVHDVAAGKTYATSSFATTYLLDRAGRLWLGADRGEWGGEVTRVDLATGEVEAIGPPPERRPDRDASWNGVYGFVERQDGQVWAYGGVSHMGYNAAEIVRVDSEKPQRLFLVDPADMNGAEPAPDRPRMPITGVVEDGQGLLVFSYSDVFRVDGQLESWKREATLRIGYRWGRPDAVGAYPSVTAVHARRRPGEPLVLGTIADGYVLLDGAEAIPRGLPGQFGASYVDEMMNTSEGLICADREEFAPGWILGAGGWKVADFAPPFEFAPDDDLRGFDPHDEEWYATRLLRADDGTIHTVSEVSGTPGTRVTGRRVGGKTERIGIEVSWLDSASSFVTRDGALWNVSHGKLTRFKGRQWEVVLDLSAVDCPYRPVAVDSDGPPWLLLEQGGGGLWRLEPGEGDRVPRLTRLEINEGNEALEVRAAIEWSGGNLLLATDRGLRVYAPSTRSVSRADRPEPAKPATVIGRDGLGRLWLGNEEGLWLSETGARTAEAFDRVPVVGRGEVSGILPDPKHEDGVIVAMGSRGVAFLRVPARP